MKKEKRPSVKGKIADEQARRSRGATVFVRPAFAVSIARLVVVPLAAARGGSTPPARAVASAPASVPRHSCRISYFFLTILNVFGNPRSRESKQNPNPTRVCESFQSFGGRAIRGRETREGSVYIRGL